MNSARGITIVVCLGAVFCMAENLLGQLYNLPASYDIDDLACGPRCVQHVLWQYGKERELTELISEIQSPNTTKGSSVASLQRCLLEHGIYAAAIRLPQGKTIDWPHPVIILRDTPGAGIGHFVVWLPTSSGSRVDIWRGVEGVRTHDSRGFFAPQGQIALLTAPSPIQTPSQGIAASTHPARVLANLMLGVFGLAVLLKMSQWARRSPFLTSRFLKGGKQWVSKRSFSPR